MRLAKCLGDVQITLAGTRGVVHIRQGVEVDLDRVIGVNGDGVEETIADQLGPHLQHFDIAPGARKPRTRGAEAPTEE